MEVKCSFKAHLKGAMVTDTMTNEMINQDIEGDGMIVVGMKDLADDKMDVGCAVVGKWSPMRAASALCALRNAWGDAMYDMAVSLAKYMASAAEAKEADDKIAELVESEIEKALSELKPEDELGEE